MIKILKRKNGEGYIDTVIGVMISMMVIVLALNVFSFLTLKQDLDYFAREMVEAAAANGRTTGETNVRYYELANETGLYPSYYWSASYYNYSYQRVQLGDSIKITLTYSTYVRGLGIFKIPITLTATHSSVSEKYWK